MGARQNSFLSAVNLVFLLRGSRPHHQDITGSISCLMNQVLFWVWTLAEFACIDAKTTGTPFDGFDYWVVHCRAFFCIACTVLLAGEVIRENENCCCFLVERISCFWLPSWSFILRTEVFQFCMVLKANSILVTLRGWNEVLACSPSLCFFLFHCAHCYRNQTDDYFERCVPLGFCSQV